ncbi:[histone H3]-dimethyl-L-lysine36 N-methyltransferase [Geosmithia morbida]|uniref:Histone-lysine N-methyltransferase, H3 lysine-36 specific n=1 Tax=Geosmithia morbida TaxID=1094350 RepID=A0A9P4YU71_9HYPO|nr:[histone H3]-dimethyl-L-lysine36 N-methyltransferase [Geosmithia morbida]KAF4123173.1 [histone H3]-dimethyl-L-lysine36 N-methyltransferase [Geosmithia morbida]
MSNPGVLMEDDEHAAIKVGGIKFEDHRQQQPRQQQQPANSSGTTAKAEGLRDEDTTMSPQPPRSEDTGTGTDTPNSQKPPRSSRSKSSQKTEQQQPPTLYDDLPDSTEDSCKTFQVITDCIYGSKNLGSTDNDAFDCDCREEWRDGENIACGEDSDCINRATKMECSSTGNCSNGCHNQRFQGKEYARVSVIKTEKKGFGLRSDAQLRPNDFIFEYIGEVINEPTFRRRMLQYDDEGVKHFYFMSLSKSEFVDATKKGNLGRFCNHSCNPNCYVDKWVVGEKLRMGIFALRSIRPGEELVFNYNVDRYGAKPQPCYCGEPNCIGFIGGKTQTERATKLPLGTVEALGIGAGDGWDTSVAKKPRKKRADEDDEEYVGSIQPRSLDEEDARKVMATLMQCKEKWIAVKLLERIQRCDEERVIHCVMRMHAYQILKTVLNTFHEDENVVMQVLSILDKFPRLTRNKIQDSKIDAAIEPLTQSAHEKVSSTAQKLLSDWSKLEVAYRIRRRQVDPANASVPSVNAFDDRRGAVARAEEPAPATPTAVIDTPRGPRGSQPQRIGNAPGHPNNHHGFASRPRHQRPAQHQQQQHHQHQGNLLPAGWSAAKDAMGKTYFYDRHNNTTWSRPTNPSAGAFAPAAEPAANKAMQEEIMIKNIIKRVTQEGSNTPKAAGQTPPTEDAAASRASPREVKESRQDRWRSMPVEKQMKIYENTIFPAIKPVLDKFHNKLPKDELKRLGKDMAKKLVASDYKNNRVEDPNTPLSEKQAAKIKKYARDFLDKAVVKFNEHQGKKSAGAVPQGGHPRSSSSSSNKGAAAVPESSATPGGGSTPSDMDRKRKREVEDGAVESCTTTTNTTPHDGQDNTKANGGDVRDVKRAREEEQETAAAAAAAAAAASIPPPPPPPEEKGGGELREQEEELMRENEEATRLEEANKVGVEAVMSH